jgi:hypothetical protein
MANLTVTTTRLVKGGDEHQMTLPASVAVAAGQAVRPDATSGKWVLANAALAANIGDLHIALSTVKAGEALTAVKSSSILDVGEALAALAFAAPVYLSDTAGTLADAAGTVSTVVGKVIPGWANTTPDKLLRVNIE